MDVMTICHEEESEVVRRVQKKNSDQLSNLVWEGNLIWLIVNTLTGDLVFVYYWCVHKGEYFDGRLSICLENYANLQSEYYDSGNVMRIYFSLSGCDWVAWKLKMTTKGCFISCLYQKCVNEEVSIICCLWIFLGYQIPCRELGMSLIKMSMWLMVKTLSGARYLSDV